METVGKSNCQIRLPKVTSKDCGFFLSCQILFPARNWEIEPTNLAFIMIFTDRKTGIIDISVAGCIIPKPKNAMMIPLDFDVGWVTQPPSPRKLSRVPWLPRRRWTLGFQFSWFPGSETMACWILSNWFSDAPTGKPGGPLNTRCVCATPPAGNGQVPEHTDSFVWLCGPHQQRRSRTHSGGFRDGRHQRQLESDQRQVCQEGWLKGGAQNGQTISNLTPFNDFQWFIGFSMGSWWGHHFIFLFLYPFINRRLHLPPWWVLSSLHWEDHPSSTLADHQVTKYGSQSSGSTSAPRRTYYDPSAFPQSKPTQRLSLVDGKFTSLITDSKLDKGAFQLTVSLDSLAEAKGVAEIPDLTRFCFFFFRLWFVPWFFQAGVPTIWGIQRGCACFVMFLFSFSLLKQIYKDIWVEYSADGLPAVWFAMAPPCQTAHPQACHQRGLDLPSRSIAESFTQHLQKCERLQDDHLKILGHLKLAGGFRKIEGMFFFLLLISIQFPRSHLRNVFVIWGICMNLPEMGRTYQPGCFMAALLFTVTASVRFWQWPPGRANIAFNLASRSLWSSPASRLRASKKLWVHTSWNRELRNFAG